METDGEGKEEGKGPGAREKVSVEAVGLAREICESGPVATRAAPGGVESARRGERQDGERR